MSQKSYVDDHPYAKAFIANRLQRLAELISEQGDAMLAQAGVEIPARCVSLILLIHEREGVSAADMAQALNVPHQLVTQRVELLINLGLVEKQPDPVDARRKIVALTERGKTQYPLLARYLAAANQAFLALEDELGVSLSEAILQAMEALGRKPLAERLTDAG